MSALGGRIAGIGLLGPGLPGWAASRPALAGEAPWQAAEPVIPPPALLPPTERRRTSLAIRLALAAATEATAAAPDRAGIETVFACSNGDGAIIGSILTALHDPAGVALSPTQFHNSVHNAPAGYWHIAAGSPAPSVSLGLHDDSLAAGLLAALTALAARRRPVLLCAYDAPLPPPLDAARPTGPAFAAALLLRPDPGAGPLLTARFQAEPAPPPPTGDAPGDALDALAAANPAARALPLLRALAAGRPARLALPLAEDAHLALELTPC
ncbi:beta-ketoacyl synthase chain length factor [Roseicella frigidaeris]|uniref:3-oxoacyl-ACP synthase n=1 Tax=Roseicella frigidaeris TaxID=2230885 RepID=A0A327M6E8_9PROT|nr:beta-ketoacyl synthase chain length factor [Roseicella frigidaeris]RAI58309.1 3-oxoacyl-ACP synthase [Roseicella frigidaeris]